MTFQRLGLAALLVSAIRGVVADPAVQEQIDSQQSAIDSVRAGFDSLTGRLSAIEATATANGTLDEDQAADLAGIKAELADLATALAGPRDDPNDNGVLAEVEPVGDVTSAAADAIVEAAPAAEAGEEQQQEEEQQQG